jgi:photosystem II stability/assembly factor-like uncharacterized protein
MLESARSARVALLVVVTIAVSASAADGAAAIGWTTQSTGGSLLDGVACQAGACVAVGDGGTVRATTDGGSNWSSRNAGTVTQLYSVSCPTASACFAGGDSGVIVASTDGGGAWTAQTSGMSAAFFGMSCPTASACYAVGTEAGDGRIVATTNGGATWTREAASNDLTGVDLNGVACPSVSTCYAVGGNGTILVTTDGGTTWTVQNSRTSNYLYGVSCTSTTSCYAVGQSIILATANGGATWTSQVATSTLNGVSCPSAGVCYAVGNSGSIVATSDSGATWTPQSSGTTNRLQGVYCAGTDACWAVGEAGTIVAGSDPSVGTSTQSPPRNTARPQLAGEPYVGDFLSPDGEAWSGNPAPSFTYQWQRCDSSGAACQNIAGATGEAYQLTTADIAATIRVVETGTNVNGSASAASAASAQIQDAPTPPSNTTAPSIAGNPLLGSVLTVDPGGWSGTAPIAYDYRWEDCDPSGQACTGVYGDTGDPTYTLAATDVGHTVHVIVTASNHGGSETATSPLTSVVTTGTNPNLGPTQGDVGDLPGQAQDVAGATQSDPSNLPGLPFGPDDAFGPSFPVSSSGGATVYDYAGAAGVAPGAHTNASGGALIGFCSIYPGDLTVHKNKKTGWLVLYDGKTQCEDGNTRYMYGLAVLKEGSFNFSQEPKKGATYQTVSIGKGYRGKMLTGISAGKYPEVKRTPHFVHYNSYIRARGGATWGIPDYFVPIAYDTECKASEGYKLLHCIANSGSRH